MNGSGRNELWAATLVALALAACTPFDKAVPDGGDGAPGAKGGGGGNSAGAAGSNSVGTAGGAGGAAGTAVAGAGGAGIIGSGGIVGGGAGANAAGAGASGTTGGAGGSSPDAGSDAPGDMAAGGGGGTNLKITGALCAKASECASDFCVDGVCCAAACTQGCMACSTDKTGSASGTCAPVKAGMLHANDCIAADPTSCGHDGKCDGAGACRNFASGTPCANESCTDAASVSNYSSARACDGHGVCALASTSTCGAAYRCSGTKCRTTCAGAGDCIPADYCAGTTCVAKKVDGQPCSSATECAQGVCGGLCCAAGCTCTQSKPGNVLKNPGFDKDLTGWTFDQSTVSRSLSDAELCPYSGSLTTTIDANGASRTISQCVRNTPLVGMFNFGARVRVDGQGSVICQVIFYTGFNCDADPIAVDELAPPKGNFGWESPVPDAELSQISGANSVSLACFLSAGSAGSTTYYLDMLYVSKVPTQF